MQARYNNGSMPRRLTRDLSRKINEGVLGPENYNKYPRDMYEYLSLKYTILNVEAILFPKGFFNLPVGLIEDTLLYIMIHHKLFR